MQVFTVCAGKEMGTGRAIYRTPALSYFTPKVPEPADIPPVGYMLSHPPTAYTALRLNTADSQFCRFTYEWSVEGTSVWCRYTRRAAKERATWVIH